MTRRNGLLGATGYTGRLTAAELARRGIGARLGARDPRRLSAVPAADDAERVTVDTSRPDQLRGFLDGLDVLITTVGPFTRLGHPVLAAAVDAGVGYVDSTGEPAFIREVYDRYSDAPVPVVPACGFDYVPGDCAIAVAEADLGARPESVRATYAARGIRPSRGTARSAVEASAAMGPQARMRATTVQTAHGRRPAVVLPWGENVLVPHRLPGVAVEAAALVPRPVALAAQVTAPATPAFLRLSAPLLRRLVDRLPDGPSDDRRGAAAVQVVAEARRGETVRRVEVDVRDMYAFTAVSLVEAALRLDGAGAMTPAQAFGGAPMLDALTGPLLRWCRLP